MGRGLRVGAWAWGGLWLLLGTLVLLPQALLGLNIFDEGFMVSGAMLIRRGWLPISDFFVLYGPGGYYLLAGLFGLFGEDLLVSRVAHALTLAGLGVLLVVLARRLLPQSRAFAAALLLCFLACTLPQMPNAAYPAVTALLPLLAALLLVADSAPRGHPRGVLVAASLLVGVAAGLRWDFGVFGFIALGLGLALQRPAGWPAKLAWLWLPGAVLGLAWFVPLWLHGDFGRWLSEVPGFHSREMKVWRGRDFWRPELANLAAMVAARDSWSIRGSLLQMLMMATPWLALALVLPAALWRCWRRRNIGADAWLLPLALLALLLLNQTRVRSGMPQGYPAFAVSLPLLAWALHQGAQRLRGRGARAALLLACALPWLGLPLLVAQSQWRMAVFESVPMPGLDRASQLRVSTRPASLEKAHSQARMVRDLRDWVPPGARLYSGALDHSRLWVNDALLYFLVDRLPATRWVEMEPGLSNTEAGQRELMAELRTHAPPALMLLTLESQEANRTSVSNGVTLLDDELRRDYQEVWRDGQNSLWRRR